MFDTNKFYDIGDFKNKMEVVFGGVVKNKINIKFKIEEEFLSIFFDEEVEVEI